MITTNIKNYNNRDNLVRLQTTGTPIIILAKPIQMNTFIYRVTFLTGPALKVLSVGDGKIPTKKVKV